jgi:hypothetical protein
LISIGLGSFVLLLVLLGAVAVWWKRSRVFSLLQSDNGNEILLLCESSFLQFHYFLETEFEISGIYATTHYCEHIRQWELIHSSGLCN